MTGHQPTSTTILDIRELTKRFGPTVALDTISFELRSAEVHALVGENGAGKSTFIKMLAGLYPPDSGTIALHDQLLRLSSPHAARLAGISVIHQDRQLVPHMSGLENLFLGQPAPRRAGWFIDWPAMRRHAAQVQADLNISVPLHVPARELSPAQQTLLEILRACMTDCRILLLDEPTAALTDHEIGTLFSLIRRLKAHSTSFIYVSHRLDEVLTIADRITVLRNGLVVGQLATTTATKENMISLITGRSMDNPPHRPSPVEAETGEQLLRVRGLSTRDGRVQDASFQLRAGEIVGFFGLAGAGRTETIEALVGLRPLAHGEISIRERPIKRVSPVRALRAGMAMIPENRRTHGLLPRQSVRTNITVQTIGRFRRWGVFIHRRLERRAVQDQLSRLAIRTQGPSQLIDQLSGGNQQKVLLARLLLADPAILLCDEPTHAVDVGTRHLIHQLLDTRVKAGCAVLFASSDLAEVLEVADRIIIMASGRTIAEVRPQQTRADEIMRLCYAGTEGQRA